MADRLGLRGLVGADAPKLLELSHEQGLGTWLPDQVYRDAAHAAEVLAFLMAQDEAEHSPAVAPRVRAVCLADSGELIGHVGLSPWQGEVEIGFAIEETLQGRGLATEAVGLALAWGRAAFGLTRILGIAASANRGSCRVLEKAGFALEREQPGVLHDWQGLVRTYAWTV